MLSSEHCRRAIFQIYKVQNLKITRITTFRISNVVYQVGTRWDPKCVFNFLLFFFERPLYKSNYIIFILSWCGGHTKIRSKLVDIVTAGSQKITLWGPQRTPLGILRVKEGAGNVVVRLAYTVTFNKHVIHCMSKFRKPSDYYLYRRVATLYRRSAGRFI